MIANILKLLREGLGKDKSVLTTLIFVPIIVPFYLHFVFGGIYLENIPFAIVDLDNSSLSRSIVQGLDNHPGLDVSEYYMSESELEEAVMNKEVVGGIILPNGMSRDMNVDKTTKVLVVVDGTNMMISGNASGYCSQVLGTYNAGIQMSVMEGKGMAASSAKNTIATFSYGERVLYEPFLSYIANLVYIVVPFVIQTYFLTGFLLPAFVEEKHYWIRHTVPAREKKERMAAMLVRILSIDVLVCVVSYASFMFYGKMENMPLRGGLFQYFTLVFVFLLAITAVALAITAFLNEKNLIYFIEFYFIMSSIIILTSGAVWPEYMMPSGLSTAIKSIWPFFHVALPIKYVTLKGVSWDVIVPYIGNCLVYLVIWLPIGAVLMRRKVKKEKERLL